MPCPYSWSVAILRSDPPVIGCEPAEIQKRVGRGSQYVLIGPIGLLICHWGLVAQTSVCAGFAAVFLGGWRKSGTAQAEDSVLRTRKSLWVVALATT
jgi:hypothetical protein